MTPDEPPEDADPDRDGDGARVADDAAQSRADAASPETVARLAREFQEEGRPFARATVVRREPPVSANVGDRALVTPDGDVVGWIGGAACARSVVVDEATAALERDEPVLVGLAPDPDEVDRPGVESYPMTCHSGGTLEVFVEPMTPAPRVVVVGESAVARALARLAGELSDDVTVVAGADDVDGADEVVPPTDPEEVADADAVAGAGYVVVASMGEFDALGVEAGLRVGATYLGLVASDERRDELAGSVADRFGVDTDTVVDAVTTPAGLDLGAKSPEEIAVSVLAELVAVRRDAAGPVGLDVADGSTGEWSGAGGMDDEPEGDGDGDADGDGGRNGGDVAGDEQTTGGDAETATDPVCGMEVTVGDAAATVDHGGDTYRFCGQGCAEAFKEDPGQFLTTGPTADD